ncbi:hypothetical protein EG329_007657 [Mollisiaceae sp. DMI_Dod_QoI]|nr:hypothetical protein EG329_007657 [Helotiales sp. DMI_Dod_QoI]
MDQITTGEPHVFFENETMIDHAIANWQLRQHLGLTQWPIVRSQFARNVHIWVELVPENAGAKMCRLRCGLRIKGGYRITVFPGQKKFPGREFYHLKCFEQIADFQDAEFLDRLLPAAPRFMSVRGQTTDAKPPPILFVDRGAKRLIEEWKHIMRRLINKRDNINNDDDNSESHDGYYKAGSSKDTPKIPDGTDQENFEGLSNQLAPIESDGTLDSYEWDLFNRFLTVSTERKEGLDDKHSLSLAGVNYYAEEQQFSTRFLREPYPKDVRAVTRLRKDR